MVKVTNFGIMRGNVGEFSIALKNELRNFQENSDYYTYQENSGKSRKKHYVICSERLAKSLQEVDWQSLKGFVQIEVGEEEVDSGSRFESEPMKFVVEQIVDVWFDYYETTNPNASVKFIDFKDLGISRSQNAQFFIEDKGSSESSSLRSKLTGEFEEGKKNKDLSRGVYRSSWEFDKDGLKDKKETYKEIYQPAQTSFSGGEGSRNNSFSNAKYCSNCRGKELNTNAKFCENCGQCLVETNSSQIREITDQEAKQIEGNQQRPFFPKPKGNF